MDQRIESFLTDVLALAGEEPDAVREGVRVALAKCEAIFRLQEPPKHLTYLDETPATLIAFTYWNNSAHRRLPAAPR
jgi:hypothetical protein